LLICALDITPLLAPVLANRLMVGVGLISYSLYLWHWPIIALVKYRGIEISLPVGLCILTGAIALSYLSWRWVELPVRHGGFNFKRAFVYLYAAPALAIFCFAALAYETRGLPGRFNPEVRQLIASYSNERDLQRNCSLRDVDFRGIDLKQLESNCSFGDSAAKPPAILLYGDSHANHFKPFLDVMAKDAGLSGMYFSMGSCAPVRPPKQQHNDDACAQRNRGIEREFGRFKYVVIAGAWSPDLASDDFSPLVSGIVASGAVPVIFKDAPEAAKDISRCALNRLRGWLPADAKCSIPERLVEADAAGIDHSIDLLRARFPTLVVINPKPLLCDGHDCVTVIGNTAIYRDSNHLNADASRLLAHRFLDRFGNPLRN
jgi:hypothetical protein